MKIQQIALALFLLYLFYISISYKESFVDCSVNTDCKSCASASGCAWCPAKNICMNSTSLKSTDIDCNQMNTIKSSFACTNQPAKDVLKNEPLYADRIEDKQKPPNVYTAPNMEYSNETVMGELSHLKGEMKEYQYALPGIVTNTMQNNMRPLIMSQLLPNYEVCP